jgi:hypothetical protein
MRARALPTRKRIHDRTRAARNDRDCGQESDPRLRRRGCRLRTRRGTRGVLRRRLRRRRGMIDSVVRARRFRARRADDSPSPNGNRCTSMRAQSEHRLQLRRRRFVGGLGSHGRVQCGVRLLRVQTQHRNVPVRKSTVEPAARQRGAGECLEQEPDRPRTHENQLALRPTKPLSFILCGIRSTACAGHAFSILPTHQRALLQNGPDSSSLVNAPATPVHRTRGFGRVENSKRNVSGRGRRRARPRRAPRRSAPPSRRVLPSNSAGRATCATGPSRGKS